VSDPGNTGTPTTNDAIGAPEGGAPVVAAPPAVPTDTDSGRMNVLLGLDLPVVVRFGRTELSIRSLTRLGPGAVIELGRSPDDPVDVLVGDRVVARGEVVIVAGNYGVRILQVITSPFRERRSARNSVQPRTPQGVEA
jgi:flagellar motor switch protein FliN/FliY